MRRWVVVCVALYVAPVSAQTRYRMECDADNPTRCAQPLLKGEIAPFPGQLLTTELAILQGQAAKYCDEETKFHVKRAEAVLRIELGLEKRLREIDQSEFESRTHILEDYLKEAREEAERGPAWYERPAFVAVVTAVVTLGTVWGSVEIVKVVGK